MKFVSKNLTLLFAFALSFGVVGTLRATTLERLFDVVPSGDKTYTQLSSLEKAGWLPAGSTRAPLTRFEVAERIFEARQKSRAIVLAQADADIPPPSDEAESSSTSSDAFPAPPAAEVPAPAAATAPVVAAPAAATVPAVAAPTAVATPDTSAADAEAEKNLKSLQEAYQYELNKVKKQKQALQDKVSKVEVKQYELWRDLKGITEYPSLSVHGLGRMIGISQEYSGEYSSLGFPNRAVRTVNGYLDLSPTFSIAKQLHWDGDMRIGTSALPLVGTSTAPGAGDSIYFRRMSVELSPDFMEASLGDFYESYTPLTLWNRNSLDLCFTPDMLSRLDGNRKYGSFLNQEPAWPFRGLRVGTTVGWPDSQVMEQVKVSAFVNMIRNGFNDTAGGGWYFGPGLFTDLTFGGKGELRTKKWYVGGTSWQVILDAYGVILDELLYTQKPRAPYRSNDPATWGQQYLLGSVKPTLRVGLGGDVYLGFTYEAAFSSYQDDKNNANRVLSDYAMMIEPYLQFGDSKITFRYLDVGPNYFSPLAQTRQDNLIAPGPERSGYDPGPWLFARPVRNMFFLANVPRASEIFSFYDRTRDNTFPYGLATPNRLGGGLELDIATLEKKSLKIKGAAYFVSEINDNLVLNNDGTGYTALDPAPDGSVPRRNFTYVNLGPSFDFGPLAGLKTPLEVGLNARYEETSSTVGTLTTMGIWESQRVGFFSWWEASAAVGFESFSGTEMGYFGTPLARYSYQFDNRDFFTIVNGNTYLSPLYWPFSVDGSNQYFLLSTNFKINRNSTLYLDYGYAWGNKVPTFTQGTGTLNNEFAGMTYEIEF
jgi:hypothetical protein